MASIILEQVAVEMPVYSGTQRSLRRAFLDRLSNRQSKTNKELFVLALDQISLHLKPGDRVGLIGHNGAGKSTLLRVLGGILAPTSGCITIEGQISSLLNMTSLLDPEMTGYENIETARLLLGIPTTRRDALLQDVLDFTELGAYLEMPLRTYSAGMQLRLSFALLTAQQPEILLLDEVIGAGDAGFFKKATQRFGQLCEQTQILVLASHVLPHIALMCNKVIWLEQGRVRKTGAVEELIKEYQQAVHEVSHPGCPVQIR
ncbi:ABC transporter ATP-binding protein [Candidatus Magnetaquicoccus inordinatus]|uniref:ABC transporter ATP-binding protein n=1 Tax=Candidatus Magnetaquicoccus inordinatus TaxID=2496818 RepID=UPI00102C9554|nr:ATP-binding cassette domain-containing protein [Candidatus Magnetaquicoccus inordinatus]